LPLFWNLPTMLLAVSSLVAAALTIVYRKGVAK
jgi:hypothetical protein